MIYLVLYGVFVSERKDSSSESALSKITTQLDVVAIFLSALLGAIIEIILEKVLTKISRQKLHVKILMPVWNVLRPATYTDQTIAFFPDSHHDIVGVNLFRILEVEIYYKHYPRHGFICVMFNFGKNLPRKGITKFPYAHAHENSFFLAIIPPVMNFLRKTNPIDLTSTYVP